MTSSAVLAIESVAAPAARRALLIVLPALLLLTGAKRCGARATAWN